MALTNTQYNSIMREYDNIRTANQHILNDRYDEVYSKAPALKDIDDKIIDISMQAARAQILGNASAASQEGYDAHALTDELSALNRQKSDILTGLDKPADYLSAIYTCPFCHDTGYDGHDRCACFKKKAIDLVYRDSNLKNITDSENFDTFSYEWYSDSPADARDNVTPRANVQKAVIIAKQFVDNFDKEFSNIVLYGNTGTGKTFLSNCMARALLDTSHSVIYLTAIEFFEKLSKRDFNKDYAKGDDSSDIDADYLTECDLLIIDDLGTEVSNTYTASRLFYIINERLLRRKSVVISTNLSLSELRDVYSERIFSRLTSAYKFICMYGDDIRTLKLTSGRR